MKKKMRNIHPGEILKMELIHERKLTVSKIAELLEATDLEVYDILNGNSKIYLSMALKIEAVFGGSADFFIRLQNNYDLYNEN